jgi:Tfp pilus assembly protein PilO
MARALSRREKNVIIAGGIFLVCFLAYWFVLSPQRDKLKTLKSAVVGMTREYKEIQRIEAQYQRLKRQTDPIMYRVLQRPKNFDLSTFIAETERLQNFTRRQELSPRTVAYGKFEKQISSFRYEDKSLIQIVDFLRAIKKSENVIAIESLTITPHSPADPSRLNVNLKVATVVVGEEGE